MILFEFGVGFFNRNQVELLTRQQVLTLSTFIHDLVCAGRSPGHPWSWPKNPGWNYCKARQENITFNRCVFIDVDDVNLILKCNWQHPMMLCYVLRWIRMDKISDMIPTYISTSRDIIDIIILDIIFARSIWLCRDLKKSLPGWTSSQCFTSLARRPRPYLHHGTSPPKALVMWHPFACPMWSRRIQPKWKFQAWHEAASEWHDE